MILKKGHLFGWFCNFPNIKTPVFHYITMVVLAILTQNFHFYYNTYYLWSKCEITPVCSRSRFYLHVISYPVSYQPSTSSTLQSPWSLWFLLSKFCMSVMMAAFLHHLYILLRHFGERVVQILRCSPNSTASLWICLFWSIWITVLKLVQYTVMYITQ